MPPTAGGMKRKASQAEDNTAVQDQTLAEAFKEAFYTDTDTDDSSSEEESTTKNILKKQRGRRLKRPRTAAPTALEISEHEFDDDNKTNNNISVAETGMINNKLALKVMNALDGPQLRVDLADLLVNPKIMNSLLHAAGVRVHGLSGQSKKANEDGYASLIDLPMELAVNIYRQVFVTAEEINFTDRQHFARSGQLLRTCRKVYADGSIILYGENAFHFSRAHKTRGAYFEKVWKEVGYKDVRRFLNDIGPHNMAKLRYVSIVLEDALPTFAPDLDWEGRKFMNDGPLLEVLTMIGKYTELEYFMVNFHGKCNVSERDYHFLKALCSIRCHELRKPDLPGVHQRITPYAWNKVFRLVQLPKKNDNISKEMNKFLPRIWGRK